MGADRERDSGIAAFVRLFLKDRGLPSEDFACHALAGDGSKRVFRRVAPLGSKRTYIAMENRPVDAFSDRENKAYLRIGVHLHEKGIPVPEIYRYDLTNGWFIMEDMGTVSLQEAILGTRDRLRLYEKVVKILFRLQKEGSVGFDTSWTCQTERYDRDVMRRFEADYFREAFLHHYLGLKKEWPELEGPFGHLAERAGKGGGDFFLHRDFQSRNLMVGDAKIGVLDWQGGRLGPLGYDLASLIVDPYTGLSGIEREGVFQSYLEVLEEALPEEVDLFRRGFPYLAIQRNLQILGAFAFLSRFKGKTYFEAYIPGAFHSLRRMVHELEDRGLSKLLDLLNALQLAHFDLDAPDRHPDGPTA